MQNPQQKKQQQRLQANVRQAKANKADLKANGASGISSNRPALERMNEDIREGRVQLVLVKDVARLFRDYFLLGRWLNEVRTYGLSVISAQDGILEDVFRPFSLAAAESLASASR